MIRSIVAFAAAALIWASSGMAFAFDSCTAENPLLLAQANRGACLDRCEKAKKGCFAQYTRSDARSGNYITPEGHQVCWGQYNQCKAACPKK